MKCIIPGTGIRAFGKAVHCLAKIGDEFYIESTINGLFIKTVNPARSAFACFQFNRCFFNSFKHDSDTTSCKLISKCLLSVFRALSSLEKSVDYCVVTLDSSSYKLTFVFHCKYGIVKTHQLGFEDCETLRAVFSKELSPNQIKQCSKPFHEAVGNFPNSLPEVTLTVKPDHIMMNNYIEDSDDISHVPTTQVSLYPDEFEDYQTGVDTSITFCLKELRAILVFTSALGDALSLRFETAGKPIVLSIEGNPYYSADFVLATLSDSETEYQESSQKSSATASIRHFSSTRSESTNQVSSFKDDTKHYSHSENRTKKIDSDKQHFERSIDNRQNYKERSLRDNSNGKETNNGFVTRPNTDIHSVSGLSQDFQTQPITIPQSNVTGNTCNDGNRTKSDPMDVLFSSDMGTDDIVYVDEENIVKAKGIGKGKLPANGRKHNLKKGLVSDVSLDDNDFYANFPHQDKFISRSHSFVTHINETPCVNLSPLLSLEEGTQESLIENSGFLPSTPPPTKKFKSLFSTMDMFGGSQSTGSILAPDSEDEES